MTNPTPAPPLGDFLELEPSESYDNAPSFPVYPLLPALPPVDKEDLIVDGWDADLLNMAKEGDQAPSPDPKVLGDPAPEAPINPTPLHTQPLVAFPSVREPSLYLQVPTRPNTSYYDAVQHQE
ncbi:hypothetical protein H0H87_004718 [Tephrocybe sp. NHM501043]|nr:hypothetical protein H0H87_004718 [Tephrocybe sp. NHM501043]